MAFHVFSYSSHLKYVFCSFSAALSSSISPPRALLRPLPLLRVTLAPSLPGASLYEPRDRRMSGIDLAKKEDVVFSTEALSPPVPVPVPVPVVPLMRVLRFESRFLLRRLPIPSGVERVEPTRFALSVVRLVFGTGPRFSRSASSSSTTKVILLVFQSDLDLVTGTALSDFVLPIDCCSREVLRRSVICSALSLDLRTAPVMLLRRIPNITCIIWAVESVSNTPPVFAQRSCASMAAK